MELCFAGVHTQTGTETWPRPGKPLNDSLKAELVAHPERTCLPALPQRKSKYPPPYLKLVVWGLTQTNHLPSEHCWLSVGCRDKAKQWSGEGKPTPISSTCAGSQQAKEVFWSNIPREVRLCMAA